MTNEDFIKLRFGYLGKPLVEQMLDFGRFETFPANSELMKEGQYVKVVPIVISGLVKIYTRFEDKELLLYYIKPEQSCIMSFSSFLNDGRSKIFAIAEEESVALLLPADKVTQWINEFPNINKLFYKQYDLRYIELVDTINQMLYHKLDKRLLDYLKSRIEATGKNPTKITHKEIATELGTAREVISRLVKKFEKQGVLKQHTEGIELV